jgi:hypothetical protein
MMGLWSSAYNTHGLPLIIIEEKPGSKSAALKTLPINFQDFCHKSKQVLLICQISGYLE